MSLLMAGGHLRSFECPFNTDYSVILTTYFSLREGSILTHQQKVKATVRNNGWTIDGSKFWSTFLPTSLMVRPWMASFFFAFFRGFSVIQQLISYWVWLGFLGNLIENRLYNITAKKGKLFSLAHSAWKLIFKSILSCALPEIKMKLVQEGYCSRSF